MPTPLLSLGVVTQMEQDVVYATPTRLNQIYVATTEEVIEANIIVDTTENWQALTPVEGSIFTCAPFIRCTTEGGALVICKAQ